MAGAIRQFLQDYSQENQYPTRTNNYQEISANEPAITNRAILPIPNRFVRYNLERYIDSRGWTTQHHPRTPSNGPQTIFNFQAPERAHRHYIVDLFAPQDEINFVYIIFPRALKEFEELRVEAAFLLHSNKDLWFYRFRIPYLPSISQKLLCAEYLRHNRIPFNPQYATVERTIRVDEESDEEEEGEISEESEEEDRRPEAREAGEIRGTPAPPYGGTPVPQYRDLPGIVVSITPSNN